MFLSVSNESYLYRCISMVKIRAKIFYFLSHLSGHVLSIVGPVGQVPRGHRGRVWSHRWPRRSRALGAWTRRLAWCGNRSRTGSRHHRSDLRSCWTPFKKILLRFSLQLIQRSHFAWFETRSWFDEMRWPRLILTLTSSSNCSNRNCHILIISLSLCLLIIWSLDEVEVQQRNLQAEHQKQYRRPNFSFQITKWSLAAAKHFSIRRPIWLSACRCCIDTNRLLGRSSLCRLERYSRSSSAPCWMSMKVAQNFCARRAVEGLQSLSIALSPPVPISAYRKRIRLEGKKVRAVAACAMAMVMARACVFKYYALSRIRLEPVPAPTSLRLIFLLFLLSSTVICHQSLQFQKGIFAKKITRCSQMRTLPFREPKTSKNKIRINQQNDLYCI